MLSVHQRAFIIFEIFSVDDEWCNSFTWPASDGSGQEEKKITIFHTVCHTINVNCVCYKKSCIILCEPSTILNNSWIILGHLCQLLGNVSSSSTVLLRLVTAGAAESIPRHSSRCSRLIPLTQVAPSPDSCEFPRHESTVNENMTNKKFSVLSTGGSPLSRLYLLKMLYNMMHGGCGSILLYAICNAHTYDSELYAAWSRNSNADGILGYGFEGVGKSSCHTFRRRADLNFIENIICNQIFWEDKLNTKACINLENTLWEWFKVKTFETFEQSEDSSVMRNATNQ